MRETKAVLTFTVIDKQGEKTGCNMIEPLDITLARIHARVDDLLKSFDLTGNITLQFVTEDKA